MGGDAEPQSVNHLAAHVREKHPGMRVGWYSGRLRIDHAIDKHNFDYIKVGPYIKHLGPLNCRTTNQRLYHVVGNQLTSSTTSLLPFGSKGQINKKARNIHGTWHRNAFDHIRNPNHSWVADLSLIEDEDLIWGKRGQKDQLRGCYG